MHKNFNMMKRYAIPLVKTFGSAALSNVRMNLSASHTRMLLSMVLLALVMLVPSSVKGQNVDGLNADQTFDFASLAQQSTTINWGDDYTGFTDNSPKYMGDINGTSLEGRFATGTKSGQGWFLRTDRTPIGLWGRKKLAFCGMWNGDRVRVTLAQGGIRFLEANSAKMNGNLVTEGQTVSAGTFVFAAARDGDVIIECTDNYTTITKVEFFNSGNNYYGNWNVSFNPSSVSLEGGQTHNTNNANVTPNWVTPTFTSSNNSVATVDENGVVTAHRIGTATITAKMDVGPEGNQWSHHATAELTVNVTSNEPVEPKYNYDPAIESYDLYWVDKTTTFDTSDADAGFPLNTSDMNAIYLRLNSGLALNDRIAISERSDQGYYYSASQLWTFGRDGNGDESQGLKVDYGWNNLSICNLKEGDRVRLTFSGSATFSSKGQNDAYNGCSAFKDTDNNGEYLPNDGDREVSCGLPVEGTSSNGVTTSYFYTITEDGHLDIGLYQGRLCKVEIYGDHQARMVDRDNEFGSKTSYFDTTGQLETKHHIVPGGLHVYIGNEDDSHHAEVVSSDKGPVSYVYDQAHYKMARNRNSLMQYNNSVPVTGTFYKFKPDVDGKMWVKFKAYSIRYNDYYSQGNAVNQYGTLNEVSTNHTCPYYLTKLKTDGSLERIDVHYYGNGADGYFGEDEGDPTQGDNKGITVEAGQTYYLFGWWNQEQDLTSENTSAGVAELIEVTFKADKSIIPLAKWVESGTTDDDDLATVNGYSTVVVKKKSDNIASCEPYIDQASGKLGVRNITFVDENKGGGTILIKVGDPNIDTDPVFAYTIAYNAGYNEQVLGQAGGKDVKRSEGHTWNFSDQPLKGLKWNNKNAEADITPFGTRFNNFATAEKDEDGVPIGDNAINTNSFLTEEYNKGDWTFNYRVKKNGQFHDPRFLNNWDMEGDNADMMWDTEGIIINAGSTQSCIFNEFGDGNIHSSNADPDRYVGFLEGGEFIIPKLKKDDRVIVYMGSGEGSGSGAMKFHITNALDAMHNAIDPADFYHAGGSQWNTIDSHNDPYYRGCYHFYAANDGDMKFEMAGGSMCKLYSIKIYRGEREETNAVQENGKGYTIFAAKDVNGNVTTSETNTWNLHYRGKGETIADGEGKYSQVNEIIAHSGNITHYANSDLVRIGNQGVSYTNQGEIGMIRVRVKCMEYNHNYVTDFADRNMTLALHETKSYPYTWDFMDIDGFSSEAVEDEYDDYNELPDSDERSKYDPKGRELSMWDENGSMVLYGPTWGYTNKNMIFENSKGILGNQLYAGGDVLPETQGLWFYFDNNDPTYNGSMQITENGLRLANEGYENNAIVSNARRGWWNYKMVVPAVPSHAAVYLRVTRDPNVSEDPVSYKINNADGTQTSITETYFYKKFRFDSHMPSFDTYNESKRKWETTYVKYEIGAPTTDYPETITWNHDGQSGSYTYDDQYEKYSRYYPAEDGSGDYIIAIYNWGEVSDLILTLNGFVLKKMSVSTDPKAVNVKGWTSESRDHDIDASLTAYLTGKAMKSYLVSNPDYKKRTLTLTDMGSAPTYVIQANTGYVIFNSTDENKLDVFGTDSGFHLFVPDMHDDEKSEGKFANVETNNVFMVPVLEEMTKAKGNTLQPFDGSYTNYILSYKWYELDADGNHISEQHEGDEMFYRVSANGISMHANSAYMQLPTNKVKPSTENPTGSAKFTFCFTDWSDDPVLTAIENANVVETFDATDGIWYNLNGQKFNSKPTTKGLYIVNGKKVLVK